MTKYGIACLILLLIQIPALSFEGQVGAVTDGDTIKVLHSGTVTKIRLANIDCPEHNQAFGQRAKQFTSYYVFNKIVEVSSQDTDRYGRTIGKVSVSDKPVDLNHALVANGLAWVYRRYCHEPSFYSLETEAQNHRIGLWVDPHPTPPWEFRRYEKLSKHLAFSP